MAALPTADFPRSSAGPARAGPRRFAVGQPVAVLKARCGDHPHRFDFAQNGHLVWPGFAPCGFSHVARRSCGPSHTDRGFESAWRTRLLAISSHRRAIPIGDDETIGSIPAQFRDFIRADDETATGSLDGFDCLAREFVHGLRLSVIASDDEVASRLIAMAQAIEPRRRVGATAPAGAFCPRKLEIAARGIV